MDNYVNSANLKTMGQLFRGRVEKTPDRTAFVEYDDEKKGWYSHSWKEVSERVDRFRAALAREGLKQGDRASVMMKNSTDWVVFDQACHASGIISVPLYNDDRGDNAALIMKDAGSKLLFIAGSEQWKKFKPIRNQLEVQRIVSANDLSDSDEPRLVSLSKWLPDKAQPAPLAEVNENDLATICYTSGTTGRPKGVMLTHRNLLTNAIYGLKTTQIHDTDLEISFLPYSHMLERTVYHLLLLAGAQIAFARSIPQLSEDLQTIKPTILVSVPRIYERVYNAVQDGLRTKGATAQKLMHNCVEIGWAKFEHEQGRGPWKASFLLYPLLKKVVASKVMEKLGGRVRFAVSGGAALSPKIGKFFVGLGLPILQGYGLTETSPLISVNRLEDNDPTSVGAPIDETEIKLGEKNELLVRGPQVMKGYWNNPEATRTVLSEDGWFNTGDQVRVDEKGKIHITGRTKEILVLANGEKVPPDDMEFAIQSDTLFEQVLVMGEGQPYLAALAYVNRDVWASTCTEHNLDADPLRADRDKLEKILINRMHEQLKEFPGYAQVRKIALVGEAWSVDNGMLTPTLKKKRPVIMNKYAEEVARLYRAR